MKYLLDTWALIWWTLDPNELSSQTIKLLKGQEALLSTISIWEVGVKIKNKKLDIGMSIQQYLEKLRELGSIQFISVSEEIWIKNLMLDWSHKDPADRTIVATALLYEATIITKDEIIRDFYPKVVS